LVTLEAINPQFMAVLPHKISKVLVNALHFEQLLPLELLLVLAFSSNFAFSLNFACSISS
jgi:hypothetical protein